MKEKRLMGKDEFVKILQKNIAKVTGAQMSLTDVWNVFKVCTYTPYEISSTEDVRVSLAGLGVFTTSKILESYEKDGVIRPKFYGSSAITDALTANKSLIEALANSPTAKKPKAVEEDEMADMEEVEEEAPTKKAPAKKEKAEEVTPEKAPAKKAPAKKAPVKKAPKVEEPVVEEEDDILSDDDFDFDFA